MSAKARQSQKSDPVLTNRARIAAQDAGLGHWERSLRINRDDDATWLVTGVLALFVAPWPFLVMGILMPEPLWGKIFTIGVGLAVLVFGLFVFATAILQREAGIGLAHFFGTGLVLERSKGELVALPYHQTRPDYLTWTESAEDSPRTRMQLWITVRRGEIAVIDARNDAEHQDVSWMAQRLGLPATPRLIEVPSAVHSVW